ncbi:hypothetical protein [Lentzea sp. NPDC055074]
MNDFVERPEDFRDSRNFILQGYRHGHSHAVFRGFPPADLPGPYTRPRVMDVVFVGLRRLCCWKDVGDIDLRVADEAEQALLLKRFGGVEPYGKIFLLNTGSIEEYVVAAAVHWAEFDLRSREESPLVSRDPEYRAANPPVGPVCAIR